MILAATLSVMFAIVGAVSAIVSLAT